MTIKACPLNIDIHKHEKDMHGTALFPCGGYETDVDKFKNIPWHWHDETEVLIVCKGTLKLELVGKCYKICEGEGAFINTGVLQCASSFDNQSCKVKSLVFNPNLICGMSEGSVVQNYIRPLLNCNKLSCILFKKNILWNIESIKCIADAFEAYKSELFGYELLVTEKLSHLWFLIVSNNKELLIKQTSINTDALRLKSMLSFIHTNYANLITLSDISKSANIGERECLRCFKRAIGITPIKYLLRYRISLACDLLSKTNLNITEICKQCGFESTSYFSLMFKKLMEITPKEYRKYKKA